MGANSLTGATDGTPIPADDHNQLVAAFKGDMVPRNNTGVATDLSGNLGSTIFRWASAFIQKIWIGDPDNEVTIEENAGELQIKIEGATKARIDATGINGADLKTASIVKSKMASGVFDPIVTTFTANGTFIVPAGVTTCFVRGVGGGAGGGGGSPGSSGGAGGGGGGGGGISTMRIPVTPGESLAVYIGAGGSPGGGAGWSGGPTGPGGSGNHGGDTYVTRAGALIAVWPGGLAGNGAASNAVSGGTGGSQRGLYNHLTTSGGGGSTYAGTSGIGEHSSSANGGPGTYGGGVGQGGGGGGGGGGIGAGGAGGLNNVGGNGSYGAGGGGGSGNFAPAAGRAGGWGGSGLVEFIYF